MENLPLNMSFPRYKTFFDLLVSYCTHNCLRAKVHDMRI
jgi:hypothetical protein